jgi:hypothetical protein
MSDSPTRTVTAEMLCSFYKKLVNGGLPQSVADEVLISAARDVRFSVSEINEPLVEQVAA